MEKIIFPEPKKRNDSEAELTAEERKKKGERENGEHSGVSSKD